MSNAHQDTRPTARDDAIDAADCAVVLVDYQTRLLPAIHGGAEVVRHACVLADTARLLGVRVIGTEQNPAGLGANVPAIAQRCDLIVTKSHFDACADGLVERLDADGPRGQIVIAGCEAHVCLQQTALGLLRRGRRVFVVDAACGSRRPSDRALALERLATAGATRVALEMVLFEWLRSHDHPRFREVLSLVKAVDTTS